jgi:4a-hydroxytetrahydrobiopterin dehydratase
MKQESELREWELVAQENAMSSPQIDDMKRHIFGWDVVDDKQRMPYLSHAFKFKDFADALHFTMLVGELAINAKHYPRITLEWGNVSVEWYSRKVGGLHRNDFIMAARTNDIYDRWDEIAGKKDKLQRVLEESFPASDPRPVGSRIE